MLQNMFDNLKGGATTPTTTITTETIQSNIESFLEIPYAVSSIGLFLIYYGSYAENELPPFISNILNDQMFKIFIMLLIVYSSRNNPIVAVISIAEVTHSLEPPK